MKCQLHAGSHDRVTQLGTGQGTSETTASVIKSGHISIEWDTSLSLAKATALTTVPLFQCTDNHNFHLQ